MTEKFSTKCPHFFPQRISFYIDVLSEFSTKIAPPCFFIKYMWKIIYTKYLTQPKKLACPVNSVPCFKI
jgi:hypothetical protein